jgi:hypothetical protein
MVVISIAIGAVVVFFLFGQSPSRRRQSPQYNWQNEQEKTANTQKAAADVSSFADIFDVLVDKDSEDFFKTQRLKEDLQRITADAKLASTEAAVGARLNDLDKKQNEFTANSQNALAQIQQEKAALQERILEVKTGAAQNAIQQQLIEISKREFALQKDAFANYIESKFHELVVKQKEYEMAKYFYEKYKTLDAQQIALHYERNELALQKDETNIRMMFRELDMRESRANMREEAAKLVTQENRLALKTDEYKYFENRAMKHMGYKSFDAYFAEWQRLDMLARKDGYISVAQFAGRVLGDGNRR